MSGCSSDEIDEMKKEASRKTSSKPYFGYGRVRMYGVETILTLIILALLALPGCRSAPEVIRDIATLVQDNTHYLDPLTADREFITATQQQNLNEHFDAMYFSPWNQKGPLQNVEDLQWEFRKYRNKPGYGENKRRHTTAWIDDLADNAGLESYPNAGYKAITLVQTNLRVLPTSRPHFSTADGAGTGFPFDNMQNSAIYANTPVYVSHVAKDKSWVYCESHCGAGWAPSRDIARIDDRSAAEWQNHPQVAVIKDDLPIYDEQERFLCKARIGSQFPMIAENSSSFRVLLAVADQNGAACLRQTTIVKAAARKKPIPLTQSNIARLANEFINEPYGWGGLFQDRDCSATTKDLFAPFSLWLPRHSSNQATQGGIFVRFKNLSQQEKVQMILTKGIPYLTLLWAPGHIMLYIGNYRDQMLIFHNMWGVRTKDMWGRAGRHVVGHAAITTLHPGAELVNFNTKSDLLTAIRGMTLLGK